MCKVVISLYHEDELYPNTYKPAYQDKETTESSEEKFCPPFWDSLSCFPATPVGKLQLIPCMSEIQTLHYGEIHKTAVDTTSKSHYRYLSYIIQVI